MPILYCDAIRNEPFLSDNDQKCIKFNDNAVKEAERIFFLIRYI
jgi:hypothetical protein